MLLVNTTVLSEHKDIFRFHSAQYARLKYYGLKHIIDALNIKK